MPALVAGIHGLLAARKASMDTSAFTGVFRRAMPGHDDSEGIAFSLAR
jgi:hypothetical protein